MVRHKQLTSVLVTVSLLHSGNTNTCQTVLKDAASAYRHTTSSSYTYRQALSNDATLFHLRNGDPLGYAATAGNSTTQTSMYMNINLYRDDYQMQVSIQKHALAHTEFVIVAASK